MSGYSATSSESVQEAKKKLIKFLRTVEQVPSAILAEEASIIEAQAKAQTPVDTGRLKDSVYVRVSKSKTRPGLNAGASAREHGYNYAGIQHDNTSYRHTVGKDHFVSDPFEDGIRRIIDRFDREVTYK